MLLDRFESSRNAMKIFYGGDNEMKHNVIYGCVEMIRGQLMPLYYKKAGRIALCTRLIHDVHSFITSC